MIQTSLFKRAFLFGRCSMDGCIRMYMKIKMKKKKCRPCRLPCHIWMIYLPRRNFFFLSFFLVCVWIKVTGGSPAGPELAARNQPLGSAVEMPHDDTERWLRPSRHRRQTKYIHLDPIFSFFKSSFSSFCYFFHFYFLKKCINHIYFYNNNHFLFHADDHLSLIDFRSSCAELSLDQNKKKNSISICRSVET